MKFSHYCSKSSGNSTTLLRVLSLHCQIPMQLAPLFLTGAWCAAEQRKMRASGEANAHQVPELIKLQEAQHLMVVAFIAWH